MSLSLSAVCYTQLAVGLWITCQLLLGSSLANNKQKRKNPRKCYELCQLVLFQAAYVTSPVLSQVVADSQSPGMGAILRVRGPLEFKCQLDSADGVFMDVLRQRVSTQRFPKSDTIRFNAVPAAV